MQEKTEKKWNTTAGKPWPLGVICQGKTVNFACCADAEKECLLRVYELGGDLPILEESMQKSDWNGAVFHLALHGLEECRYEYCYVRKGKEYPDLYAQAVKGRREFGIREKQVIGCRSSFAFSSFDWQEDQSPSLDFAEMFLYKLHVRGFTKHESSRVRHKGTYLGVLEKLDYIKELGVNAILLMPCVEFDEIMQNSYPVLAHDQESGHQIKLNYWGYGAKSFYFAPKVAYASEPNSAELELKTMIRTLHKHGIEVLMEFCFDDQVFAGFILDCLRFWVREYHIDGFRFIGSSAVAGFIAGDPYLAKTKFLSESFSDMEITKTGTWTKQRVLAECNNHFLTDIRQFLKGDEGQVQKAAELFKKNSAVLAKVNYIADSNGFTLMDLYTYDLKHNEANEEGNRDGQDQNFSWNCGEEGKSRKKKTMQLRLKMIKNALTMLFLSQGTPMLLAGDEFGNSQNGNNNAYCQDNSVCWLEWNKRKYESEIFLFVKRLITLRKEFPIFCNRQELSGRDFASFGSPDISFHGTKAWYPDYSSYSRTLGVLLSGRYVVQRPKTEAKSVYLVINMHWDSHEFDLPALQRGNKWETLIFTDEEKPLKILVKTCIVPARSIAVFMEGNSIE